MHACMTLSFRPYTSIYTRPYYYCLLRSYVVVHVLPPIVYAKSKEISQKNNFCKTYPHFFFASGVIDTPGIVPTAIILRMEKVIKSLIKLIVFSQEKIMTRVLSLIFESRNKIDLA